MICFDKMITDFLLKVNVFLQDNSKIQQSGEKNV